MLDVRRLRVLRQLAHDGTIAGAARSLHMTGPAVSQHLHALEREAGAKLLERDGRTLRLTAAAQALVAHTETILAQLELAQADLDASEGRFGDELRVAAFPTAALALLAPAVAELLTEHPGLRVRVDELEPDEALSRLQAGDLDLVVAHSYDRVPRRLDASLETTELLREPLWLAVSGPGERLEDFADHPWISPPADMPCALEVERTCAGAGFEPNVTSRVVGYDQVLAFVAAGVGVALVPDLAAVPTDGVRLIALDGPFRTIFAATRRGSASRPALIELRAALLSSQRCSIAT
jgi:DNA-binding transcriptional LysR family regulator